MATMNLSGTIAIDADELVELLRDRYGDVVPEDSELRIRDNAGVETRVSTLYVPLSESCVISPKRGAR